MASALMRRDKCVHMSANRHTSYKQTVHGFLCFPWRQVLASNANSATTHPGVPNSLISWQLHSQNRSSWGKTNNLKAVDGLWIGLRLFGQYCKLRQMLGKKYPWYGLISYTVELKQTHTHADTQTKIHCVTKSFMPCPPPPHTHIQSKQKCHSWNNSHFQC